MEHSTTTDWDSVLQFVAEPLEFNYPSKTAEAAVGQTEDNSQVPTPPLSHDGTPVTDPPAEGTTLVSISTTFYPGAQLNELPPDTVLLASDGVFFYVHASVLLASSTNDFNNLIASDSEPTRDRDPMLSVQEDSTILNVILHIIYDMSCAHYSPPFPALVAAVNHLPTYGISPKAKIIPSTPTFTLLLSNAPLYPLEVYALAASFDLYDLAVATSSHLLSFPLATLTDEMAELIGPIYLKRLFFLHFGRSDALKRVLLPPPHPHAPTPWCDFDEQKKLTRAWALASAYLAWDARPDLSTSVMESALRPLADHLTCEQCQQGLRERIKDLLVQWTVVKRTI
ncbi:hypothetical protein Agabi119p4_4597 [Agaricus bisporus var. burnettii]|uniref:BTB domain-containing protein n=1 Tax=Agaricus bisporus var. burnettii TaxID=192524 RepID=A0A8H7KH33_AGABI|nr:hypothetical protein Agabi119p4_4597 [Agaricus bisporus var. burnettii]